MWTEGTLLDAAFVHFDALRPIHLLRQVEMEDRRIDAVLVNAGRRIGIEAKVSRADFRRESDAKREPTWRATHGCVYLAPPGVIDAADLPPGWGLWVATGPGSIKVVRAASPHEPEPAAADRLATALLTRAAATERRIRVAEAAEDPVGALVAVETEVQRLDGLVSQAQAAVARERARANDAAEQVMAAVGEQDCSCCGGSIVYTRVGAWRHVDRSLSAACERERAERERVRKAALTGAEYVSVKAPRITPAGLPT